jgi:hypothetical protein
MLEDDKLLNKKLMILINRKFLVPLKIFGLYCAAVCKSGGKA